MRKYINVVIVACLVFVMGCKFIPPGHVGVRVDLFGSSRGVQGTTIVTGRVYYNPYSTAIYEFPTFMQYQIWTKSADEGKENADESITFVSKDKIQVNVDVSVAYQFEAEKVPQLFVQFRQPPDIIANTYIRSRVRDAFVQAGGKLNAMDIIGSGISVLDSEVYAKVNSEMAPIGIHFDYVSVVGHARIPDAIQNAINQAIESTQQALQAQNQVAVVKAQADQTVAKAHGEASAVKEKADGDAAATLANATAQAKANLLLSQSITPELIKYKTLETWNGVLPVVSGGQTPILDLRNLVPQDNAQQK